MTKLIMGFTGTRHDITKEQKERLVLFIKALLKTNTLVGVHGDCIGADAAFNSICKSLDIIRHKYPSTLKDYTAHTDAIQMSEPLDPLVRNKIIVNTSSFLIACPGSIHEKHRSGTWSTVRHARKQNKHIVIIFPDGLIVEEYPGITKCLN